MEPMIFEPIQTCTKRIVFISDLHFDFVNDETEKDGHQYNQKMSSVAEIDFIKYAKENFADDILCLLGDFYNNWKKTLAFVKEMEKEHIVGFFVLGDHDYWGSKGLFSGIRTYDQIIKTFDLKTAKHKYFKFLKTGKKYFVDDLCFIGDTGWTSFQRITNRYTDGSLHSRQVDMKSFMTLPDARKVKDFDPQKILAFHNEWIKFANAVIGKEEKVIVITHTPMYDQTTNDDDCWWSSNTKLLNTDNQWRIFGHAHKRTSIGSNNAANQRRYDYKILDKKSIDMRQKPDDNNILSRQEIARGYLDQASRKNPDQKIVTTSVVPLSFVLEEVDEEELQEEERRAIQLYNVSGTKDIIPFQTIMNNYYTSSLAIDSGSGYIRPAANKKNFAHLSYDKDEYLARVRKEINRGVERGILKKETIEALITAADYLEHHVISDDIRGFITAAIITGYAWNKALPFLEEKMRPVSDYDIARFYLQFLTMKTYNIDFNAIETVRSSKKDKITFGNVDLWLPVVNGKQLTPKQVMIELRTTPLLEYVNPREISSGESE